MSENSELELIARVERAMRDARFNLEGNPIPDEIAMVCAIARRALPAAGERAVAEFEFRPCVVDGVPEACTTWFRVGNQQFIIGDGYWDNREEADAFVSMFKHALSRLHRTSAPGFVVPEGYVLVPVEPTIQMCEAMGLKWESPWAGGFPVIYRAMLASAPAAGGES